MKAQYLHWLAIFSFLGLFGLLMFWQTILAPSSYFPVAFVLLLSVSPLLIPLRGFLNGNKKSCSWMAYLSLFYLIHGVVECYANSNERLFAIIELTLSLQLFFSCIFYVRAISRHV